MLTTLRRDILSELKSLKRTPTSAYWPCVTVIRVQLPSDHHWWSGRSRGEGKVFPGPATFGGPPSLKNTEKSVSDGLFLTSYMHKVHFLAGAPPRTPLGELTTLPQTHSRMVRGHPSPCFPLSSPSASRSRRIRNKVVIGTRDNGFPGPSVALCLHNTRSSAIAGRPCDAKACQGLLKWTWK